MHTHFTGKDYGIFRLHKCTLQVRNTESSCYTSVVYRWGPFLEPHHHTTTWHSIKFNKPKRIIEYTRSTTIQRWIRLYGDYLDAVIEKEEKPRPRHFPKNNISLTFWNVFISFCCNCLRWRNHIIIRWSSSLYSCISIKPNNNTYNFWTLDNNKAKRKPNVYMRLYGQLINHLPWLT